MTNIDNNQMVLTTIPMVEFQRMLETAVKTVVSKLKFDKSTAPQQPESEELLSQKDTAKLFGISEITLIQWKKKGIIDFHKVESSNRVFYKKSDIMKVLQKN